MDKHRVGSSALLEELRGQDGEGLAAAQSVRDAERARRAAEQLERSEAQNRELADRAARETRSRAGMRGQVGLRIKERDRARRQRDLERSRGAVARTRADRAKADADDMRARISELEAGLRRAGADAAPAPPGEGAERAAGLNRRAIRIANDAAGVLGRFREYFQRVADEGATPRDGDVMRSVPRANRLVDEALPRRDAELQPMQDELGEISAELRELGRAGADVSEVQARVDQVQDLIGDWIGARRGGRTVAGMSPDQVARLSVTPAQPPKAARPLAAYQQSLARVRQVFGDRAIQSGRVSLEFLDEPIVSQEGGRIDPGERGGGDVHAGRRHQDPDAARCRHH